MNGKIQWPSKNFCSFMTWYVFFSVYEHLMLKKNDELKMEQNEEKEFNLCYGKGGKKMENRRKYRIFSTWPTLNYLGLEFCFFPFIYYIEWLAFLFFGFWELWLVFFFCLWKWQRTLCNTWGKFYFSWNFIIVECHWINLFFRP